MKNVNQDVFASFADAQMSKEEMKMVKGGGWNRCYDIAAGKEVDVFISKSGNYYIGETIDLSNNQVSPSDYSNCYVPN